MSDTLIQSAAPEAAASPTTASREAPCALLRMTRRFPRTALWNDSADPVQLAASIGFGAVGATCNPVIALAAVRADRERWEARIAQIHRERPTATEGEIGWQVVEELSTGAAAQLLPAFEATGGRNGRLSIQTNPQLAFHTDALVAQAERFAGLAPNVIVKIPATAEGIAAIEEATYRGIATNATVSFTVPQAVAVAEAVERGLERRATDGLPDVELGSVATIMGGRLDDWLKVQAERRGLLLTPGALDWAGVAALKNAYRIFIERGYRTRVLSAAFRNRLQLTELVGGDLVLSPPFEWQARINAADLELDERIDVPVAPEILAELSRHLPDFVRAYEPDGMAPEEFASFGATRQTLRQFLAANAELEQLVRDVVVPAP
ncbi:MAG: transaldolase family protein [Salana multivorans]|uniref:transaldolase family protein n=1 Tax=Salana multivorans TaxID=120377 RepID=UPI000AD82C53|nr:transaldolase family protein [Salana multivorans]MBN8883065.1 transaldolase family protein [Salana multivorans]